MRNLLCAVDVEVHGLMEQMTNEIQNEEEYLSILDISGMSNLFYTFLTKLSDLFETNLSFITLMESTDLKDISYVVENLTELIKHHINTCFITWKYRIKLYLYQKANR